MKDLLKKYGLEGCKKISTPMATSTKLDADEVGKAVDQRTYIGMIGSLLYLTASRPDIQFSVCLCARFQANSKESHLIVVKRIFRYLSEMVNIRLWYPRGCEFTLHAFLDADYAGCKLNGKLNVSYLGLQGSKGQLHCPQLKQSMLLLEVVAHKFFGSNINYIIMDLY